MNMKENALKIYRHQKSETTPNLMEYIAFVGLWGGNECGLRGEEVRPGVTLDSFGVEWVQDHRCPVPAIGNYILEDISDWRTKVVFPDINSWDWDSIAKTELEGIDRNEKLVEYFCEQGCFDRLTAVMGFENALIAMVEDPDECAEFFAAVADYKINLIDIAAEVYRPDMFMYTDDIATVRGLFMSVESYRKLLKPQQARIMSRIKSHGMIAEQHTCGKCDDVISDYVEAGVESWMPAQPCNDLVSIIKEYGDKLTVVGGFDSQGPCGLDGAESDLLIAEGRRCADEYATLGSFIAFPLVGLSSDGNPTEDEIRRIGCYSMGFRERCNELGI